MWFEMSWVDPRIAICPCGKRGESRIHVEHEEDLWLPDLHIMEAKQVNNIKGLTTDRENIQVTFKDSMQPVVVYSLNFRAVLDCHIDTFQSRNKCPVRFGSYVYDNTKVVFQQNSQFLDDKIVNSKYYLELLQLDKKAKEVRFQLKKNQVQEDPVFAYDGFKIIFEEKTTSTYVQIHVTMIIFVSLALLCLFALSGYPRHQIDRTGLFSATLLGSILTLVQLTDSTPDGLSPLMSFFRVCIVGILFCLAYFCILIVLTFDELITEIFQHRISFGLLVVSLCALVVWLSYHFWDIWDQ